MSSAKGFPDMIIHICCSLALALVLVSTSLDFCDGSPSVQYFFFQSRPSPYDSWKSSSAIFKEQDVKLICIYDTNHPPPIIIFRNIGKENVVQFVDNAAGEISYEIIQIGCEAMGTYLCGCRTSEPERFDLGLLNCEPRFFKDEDARKIIFASINERRTTSLDIIAYPNITSVNLQRKVSMSQEEISPVIWSWSIRSTAFNFHQILFTISNISTYSYGEHKLSVSTPEGHSLDCAISLRPVEPPKCPNDFNITSPGLTNVTIAWRPGFDGGSSQWFDVSYKVNNETVKDWSLIGEVFKPYVDITGLQEGTNYVLKAEPKNKDHKTECIDTLFFFYTESSPSTESNDSPKDEEDTLMVGIILSVVVLAVIVCTATIVGIILYKKITPGKFYFRMRVPKDPMTTTTPSNPRVQYHHRESNSETFDSAERHFLDSRISSGNTLDRSGHYLSEQNLNYITLMPGARQNTIETNLERRASTLTRSEPNLCRLQAIRKSQELIYLELTLPNRQRQEPKGAKNWQNDKVEYATLDLEKSGKFKIEETSSYQSVIDKYTKIYAGLKPYRRIKDSAV